MNRGRIEHQEALDLVVTISPGLALGPSCGTGNYTNLFLLPILTRLYSIATLDHIRLEADWTCSAMQLEEQTTSIAQD